MDLKDDLLSDDEVYSDTDNGEYFSTDESLEEILDFKSSPCTVVSFQEKYSLTDLDPSAVLRSSEVPDTSNKWEDVDLGSFVFWMKCLWSFLTKMSCFPALLVLFVPLLILLTMLKIFLGDIPHLNTYFLQSQLIVMMQFLFVLS